MKRKIVIIGKNCKIIYLIILIYHRSEKNKNISKEFIEFFNSYFKKGQFSEEKDLNLRFYVSILQSYLQYLKTPNTELINEWENNFKPFLLKIYPFQQNGIFNINADIKFLIQEIDDLIKKGKSNKYNVANKNFIYKKKTNINENRINIKQNLNKNKEKEEEEELSPLKINTLQKENEEQFEKNINNIKIIDCQENKDNNQNNKLLYCSTISSRSTTVSIYDIINKNDSIKSRNVKEQFNKSRSLIIPKEINPNFYEEFETEKITIVHKKNDKTVISKITFNLFLKKIVINNFFNEYIIYATNFAEQCFYFIKKEIVFKKIINCYNYYSNLKVPLNQRRNLIFLMNLLVIKMYSFYIKINNNDECLILLKDFYNNIRNELKQNINKSKKTSEIIQDFFVGGINAIIQGVNNIKDNFDKKSKNIIPTNNVSKSPENQKKNLEKEDIKMQNINNTEKKEMNNKTDNNKENEIIEDEDLLNECETIMSLFKNEQQKNELLLKIEKKLYIYVLKVKFKIKINSLNKNNKLSKSYSERNMSVFNFDKKNKKNNNKKNYFYCLEWDTRDIGEELIYVSQTALNSIKRNELYNGAFTKKNKQTTCPGIMENIKKFNNLTFFIIEDILAYDLPQTRAKIIEKWANVAEYCRRRKDYNDIFSINSAINHFLISNLKLTWKEIGNRPMKLIKDINFFCSFEGNYKNVREDMKLLTRNDFYTPYLGLLLKDLNFYEENYRYLDNGNLICFDKINGVQSAIDKFFHFQKTADKKVTMLPDDLSFFENLDTKNESNLERLAQKLEPHFTLYLNPKSEKRLTDIDKKYFQDGVPKNQ